MCLSGCLTVRWDLSGQVQVDPRVPKKRFMADDPHGHHIVPVKLMFISWTSQRNHEKPRAS